MGTANFLRTENLYEPLPQHILATGQLGIAVVINQMGGPAVGTAAWPSNNLAMYIPLTMPLPFTVARFMTVSGANITGNVDLGLYSFSGTLLISTGTTARVGASAIQYIDVVDQQFPAGQYYLAAVGSSTTGTYARVTFASAARARIAGVLEEALGSTVLPATITPVTFTGVMIHHFGFTQSDTI